jgi:hypothetical protein
MNNKVSEQYFNYSKTYEEAKALVLDLAEDIGFSLEEEIFCGRIYDQDKVGSLIYSGIYDDGGKKIKAVLKVQFLRLEHSEAVLIAKWNHQNQSKIIRLPEVFISEPWDDEAGLSWLISESLIDCPKIYQGPLATDKEREEFCGFYQEYKTKCLRQPLFPPTVEEQKALAFISQRVNHWSKIALVKHWFGDDEEKIVALFMKEMYDNKYLENNLAMEFMHGHLTADDVRKKNDQYVITSNLFWSWRPEWYDATFHLWAGIKSLTDVNLPIDEVIAYLDRWQDAYNTLLMVKQMVCKSRDFLDKFNLMMMERCVGALVVDINVDFDNQPFNEERQARKIYLKELFSAIFYHYCGLY